MKKLVPFLFALVLLTGCSSIFDRGPQPYDTTSYGGATESSGMVAPESVAVKSMALAADSSAMPSTASDRQIIKTGNLNLHVQDVRASVSSITDVVNKEGGNVIDSSVTRGDRSYSGYMNVRVPADKYDEAMTALKALAVIVESEDTNSNDVTEYYTDLQTQLSNKQAEEAQYLTILKQATNVTDTLSVTQALNDVQYQIESLQAQIKQYDTQIDYSTITISLSEDESVQTAAATWDPATTFHGAQSDLVVFYHDVLDGLIYAGVFGWPVLLLVFVIWLFRRARHGKRR